MANVTKVKYVTFPRNGCPAIAIFPDCVEHSAFKGLHPISAGFMAIEVHDGEPVAKCYGESVGLKLKSRPQEDTLLAETLLRGE